MYGVRIFTYLVKYVKGRKIKVSHVLNDVTKLYEGMVVNSEYSYP
jgi:hypothetical protein